MVSSVTHDYYANAPVNRFILTVLLCSYDSVDDGITARLTPHTAFQDPTTPADAPPRESIELRTLVFYD